MMSNLIKNFYVEDFPSIIGKYCNLEPFNLQEHKLGLFKALGCNDAIFANNLYGPFYTLLEFENWLSLPNVKQKQLVVIIDNEICGLISVHNIDFVNYIAEIGVTFSLKLQNTTASTESIYLILNHLFNYYHFRVIQWQCSCKNIDSINAAKRLGFTEEMVCKAYYVYKNEVLDGVYLSMLESEWHSLSDKYTSWLSTYNFDEFGQQKSSLNQGLIKYKSYPQSFNTNIDNWKGVSEPDIHGFMNSDFIIEKLDLDVHAESILDFANKFPEMFYFKNYGSFRSKESLINFFKQFDDAWYNYCIFDRNKEKLLGIISLILISKDSGVVELYWLMVPDELSQNKDFQVLVETIETFLFVKLHYLRIQIACVLNNLREFVLLQKFQFGCDGIFRNYFIHNNNAYDMAIFSKINQDFLC